MTKEAPRIELRWLFVFFVCQAFTISSAARAENESDEIGGLVMDRTMTRFGKQFYEEFCIRWREVMGSQEYNVVIVESPIPQSGTQVFVEIDHTRVFQAYFGRRDGTGTQDLAGSAVFRSAEFIATRMGVESSPDLYSSGY